LDTRIGAVALQVPKPAAIEALSWHPVALSGLIFQHGQNMQQLVSSVQKFAA